MSGEERETEKSDSGGYVTLEFTPRSYDNYLKNPAMYDEYVNFNRREENIISTIIECENEGGEDVQAHHSAEENINPTDDIEDSKTTWVDAAVKLLISNVEELRPLVGKSFKLRNKRKMWDAVQSNLSDAGYSFTVNQIENKYRGLERTYKRVKCHNNKTGRDRRTCPYEKELDRILQKKSTIFPEIIVGAQSTDVLRKKDLVSASTANDEYSQPSSSRYQMDDSSQNVDENNANLDATSSSFEGGSRSTKTKRNEVLDELKKLRDDRKQFQEEIIKTIQECHQEKVLILKEKNAILNKLCKD